MVSQLDVAPTELVPFSCVSSYKDLAPTEPLFTSLLRPMELRFRSALMDCIRPGCKHHPTPAARATM
jgi:hypothetical protein